MFSPSLGSRNRKVSPFSTCKNISKIFSKSFENKFKQFLKTIVKYYGYTLIGQYIKTFVTIGSHGYGIPLRLRAGELRITAQKTALAAKRITAY